ncbi:DUF4878 domain-containing protein [Clostridium botulinum]|uniref:Uncharacterized protein n=1 Tax=Clostridium botulinum C/D str. DC5 TaxID=1443128 RepID=A0A0A0IK20_CLOBO|nr:DUF4878 domain-containing protein [Clostridium botulinum]KEI01521.1 hypothetical protein Z952_11725 [Clostridium botulinum C/D str. BKT75002]KEI07855.1 hypothetical protein Z954_02860 [Clostridium botulinum C/D str. BKT2873]KGM94857.1 hypothetical protein Z956_06240 [Clostridium botulinum D str. CCUG 7971]KGN01248.1 hypothetical protein Z955_01560 [Clostridium botulinum C/D str. DC5]KOC49543.1 hypothetical protein ADU88_05120 [Clostridium botulinum]
MKLFFKKLIPLLFVIILTFSLTGCGTKPTKTTENFFNALKQQDIETASSLLQNNTSKKQLKYDDAEQEKIVKSVFSKMDYTLGDITETGNTATVKVSITSIDLPKITTKIITDLFPTMMAQAFSQEKVDEKKQDTMVFQSMLNSVNEHNAPKTKTDVTIKLVKGNNGWIIEPTDELLNALTGNFYTAFGELNTK